jgi:hypothetical protein
MVYRNAAQAFDVFFFQVQKLWNPHPEPLHHQPDRYRQYLQQKTLPHFQVRGLLFQVCCNSVFYQA